MKIAEYIPTNDNRKELWLKNFSNKLPQYCTKYNITTNELNEIQQYTDRLGFWLNLKYQWRVFDKSLTEYTNSLILGSGFSVQPTLPDFGTPPTGDSITSFRTIRSITQRIKTHYNYTTSDGYDLGIEAPKKNKTDFESIKPQIAVRLMNGGKVQVAWTKNNMDCIEIHVNRGDGYKFLANDTHPNYTDNYMLGRDQTAIWKYRAIYIKDDSRVGQWSNEVSITVTGH